MPARLHASGQATLKAALSGESQPRCPATATSGCAATLDAIGRANALTPISIILPCHRVIAADGSMTGYSAGLC